MSERIRPQHLLAIGSMQFQQHWEARLHTPLSEISSDTFLDVRQYIRVGDLINICLYNHERTRLVEFTQVRIVDLVDNEEEKRVDFVAGEIVKCDEALTKKPAKKAGTNGKQNKST